jgi:hypothetical protein
VKLITAFQWKRWNPVLAMITPFLLRICNDYFNEFYEKCVNEMACGPVSQRFLLKNTEPES